MNKEKSEIKHNSFFQHIFFSSTATLGAHPARVFLNRASFSQNPIATIRDSSPYLLKGIGFNLARGSLSTGVQSYSKQVGQKKFGLMGGLLVAGVFGTAVASIIETAFIRKTFMAAAEKNSYSLWRFNSTLTSLYFARELGFCVAVLAKNDLSPAAQYGVLFGGAWWTAAAHKFAALEAIRDKLPAGVTIPNFKEGIMYTFRSMAHGGVYTHPVFQVPFSSTTNPLLLTGNFLHVSCGLNMFLFRLFYLSLFREMYDETSKNGPALLAAAQRFFSQSQKTDELTGCEELPNDETLLPCCEF